MWIFIWCFYSVSYWHLKASKKKKKKKKKKTSGQLIFKYVFSKLFQYKRLLKYDTYMES